MRIMLEGCDGTGKTTLAEKLAAKYHLDICHCTSADPNDFHFYMQTIRKNNVIWDRHTIGELIYPMVFGRKANIATEDTRIVLEYARELDTRMFILTCDQDVIYKRLLERGDEHPAIMKNYKLIDELFRFYGEQYFIPVIDTMKMSFEEICRMIEEPQKKLHEFIHK